MNRPVILHRGAVHSEQPRDYPAPRFVRPIPPELLARVMRDDDALNQRADGGQFSPRLTATLSRYVTAFCVAVAVGSGVYFAGQMLRGWVL